ncbi:hypothetical protein MQX03_07670 [Chryseobacterium aahli]|uniref:hypothetical protein n=1 Tax=Chryseobacterium aahli TaxID=1278643 RepID=UPI001F602025|nr:hypothetical protein [Chryseobacterium aahli]MCI3937073.1 hypothetical protein [Chryseobacterium aahli]
MQIKFNNQKKITTLSDQGIAIKESSKNFEFSTGNANNNSKRFSIIKTLGTIESLSSLFLLIKGTPFYQIIYQNLSIDKVSYAVNLLLNP